MTCSTRVRTPANSPWDRCYRHSLDAMKAAAEEQKKQAEDRKKLESEAAEIRKSALTPLEEEAAKVAELNKLREAGLITQKEFDSAKAKAEHELHGDAHFTQSAATRGSQESFSLMNQINNRSRSGAEGVAKKHLSVAEHANKLLDKIATKVGGGPKLSLVKIGA